MAARGYALSRMDESAVVGVWHRSEIAAYTYLPTWQAFTLGVSTDQDQIVDALKQCIDAHGPITRQNLSSANKRVRPVGSDE